MRKAGQMCVLEERLCIECGDCDRCELTPEKICNNCCECINEPNVDYLGIEIEDILINTDQPSKGSRPKTFKIKSTH